MAKGFKHGAGGASLLNFKVVGGTSAPSNPKENTIWVNTSTEITGWQFASDDPNLLDVNAWANNTPVANGSKSVSGNSISITADSTGNAYTHWSGQYALAYANIPCEPGKTYVLEWDHTGGDGRAMIFPYATTTGSKSANASAGKLEYTPADGVSYFTFRFDSRTVNGTATYSNIRITEKERAFESGAVWISVGSSSPAAFNALKKNNITVYPISAKQYVSGAWVDKTAKIYQDGEWIEVRSPFLYIFKSGQGELVPLNHFKATNTLITVTNDNITYSTNGGNQRLVTATKETIDLRDYSNLYARVKCTSIHDSSGNPLTLGIFSTVPTSYWDTADIASATLKADSKITVYSVPIPSDVETACVGLHGFGVATVYDIWME